MVEKKGLWNSQIVAQALVDSFRKLDPRGMVKNPVMFVVEVGSVLTTALLINDAVRHYFTTHAANGAADSGSTRPRRSGARLLLTSDGRAP